MGSRSLRRAGAESRGCLQVWCLVKWAGRTCVRPDRSWRTSRGGGGGGGAPRPPRACVAPSARPLCGGACAAAARNTSTPRARGRPPEALSHASLLSRTLSWPHRGSLRSRVTRADPCLGQRVRRGHQRTKAGWRAVCSSSGAHLALATSRRVKVTWGRHCWPAAARRAGARRQGSRQAGVPIVCSPAWQCTSRVCARLFSRPGGGPGARRWAKPLL